MSNDPAYGWPGGRYEISRENSMQTSSLSFAPTMNLCRMRSPLEPSSLRNNSGVLSQKATICGVSPIRPNSFMARQTQPIAPGNRTGED